MLAFTNIPPMNDSCHPPVHGSRIAFGVRVLALALLSTLSAEAGILEKIDYETGDLSQVKPPEITGPTASVTVSTAIARRGTYSVRSYVQTADRRAEAVAKLRGTVGGVNWYGWSVYFPSNFPGDGQFDIFSQFHDWHNNQPAWSLDNTAPTCFLVRNGRMQIDLKYQDEPLSTAHRSFDLGAYTKGAWHDIVVHVKWTHLTTGFLKIWINGALTVDYIGPTYLDYGANNGPYFKMGNYKGTANWTGTSPRIIYVDEFRMGDANSSYAEVNPGPLAYEGFNYTAGTNLAGANGGSGWSSAWSILGGAGTTNVVGPGFAYAGLPASGQRFRIVDTDGVHQEARRTLSKTFGAVQETYWISFLAQKLSSGREAYINFGSLGFKATSSNWQVKTGTAAYVSIPGASYSALHLFVVRVDAGATADTVHVWMNPMISAGEPTLTSAAVAITNGAKFSFNTVGIRHGPYGNDLQSGEWDELRLGPTFSSVTR